MRTLDKRERELKAYNGFCLNCVSLVTASIMHLYGSTYVQRDKHFDPYTGCGLGRVPALSYALAP